MVTENQANAWLGQQIGQHLDYDLQYDQQCFDFFNYYYQFLTGGQSPYSNGYGVDYAKQIWDVETDVFDKIPDSNNLTPNVGDVLVYGSAWGGSMGHVEVCRWSDAGGCHVVGENEHNNRLEGVVEVYRSWESMRGLIGVLRPRFTIEQPVIINDPLPPVIPEVPHELPKPVETPPTLPETPKTPPTPPVPSVPENGTSSPQVPKAPKPWNQLPDGVKRVLHTAWQVTIPALLTQLLAAQSSADVKLAFVAAGAVLLAYLKSVVVSWFESRRD